MTGLSSSAVDDNHVENVNFSENFQATASNHEGQLVEKFAGVSSSSGGKKIVQVQCESGLNLRVDLKNDSNSEYDLNRMDLPTLTASPQDCSSPQVHLPDSGSETLVWNNINIHRASDLLLAVSLGAHFNKVKIAELASEAMEELTKLALAGKPLWQVDPANNKEVLSDIEYMREFGDINATLTEIVRMVEVRESQSLPSLDVINNSQFSIGSLSQYSPQELGTKPVTSEASREIGVVKMNAVGIVELLMDFRQWSQSFSNIVSRTKLVGVLASTGVEGNYDGTLQVMAAEFQAPTPFVPIKHSYFARYCKKLGSGMWGVVDVSLENLFQLPSRNFRRRPSGCLIQEMPDGLSQVIWVEHAEVDNGVLVGSIFEPLVSSGFAFSAKRWVATLLVECEWLATLMARRSTLTINGVFISQHGRRSLLKLSERMTRSFFNDNISASPENNWMSLPVPWYWPIEAEGIRIAVKNSVDDPGKPPGTRIIFATSMHFGFSPKQIFDFLRDEKSRSERWDVLELHREFHEYAYFNTGDNPANRVSILQAINKKTQKVERFYLQKGYTDPTGSYVVFAPIDQHALTNLINGGNPDFVAILPSGFYILPDKPTQEGEIGGSLLTLAFHIVYGTEEFVLTDQHVNLVHHILTGTMTSIQDTLGSMTTSDND